MSSVDSVVASLEHLAERAGDVSDEMYRRFASRCPASAGLMGHMDDYMRGRMMQDVLVLLMTPPAEIDGHYLSFEVSSHRAYGVTEEMFSPLLHAVRDTVREHLGDAWSAALDTAWSERIDALGASIDTARSAEA